MNLCFPYPRLINYGGKKMFVWLKQTTKDPSCTFGPGRKAPRLPGPRVSAIMSPGEEQSLS
jgi:hypothetical protein